MPNLADCLSSDGPFSFNYQPDVQPTGAHSLKRVTLSLCCVSGLCLDGGNWLNSGRGITRRDLEKPPESGGREEGEGEEEGGRSVHVELKRKRTEMCSTHTCTKTSVTLGREGGVCVCVSCVYVCVCVCALQYESLLSHRLHYRPEGSHETAN